VHRSAGAVPTRFTMTWKPCARSWLTVASVADALRLDDLERRHLAELVRPAKAEPEKPVRARAALRSMIYALDPTPAMLYGPHLEVLAVNRMGVLLFDDFEAMPLPERNMLHWMFLNPKARQVYPDWSEIAAQLVAILRLAAGRDVDDRRLAALVGELSAQSDDFARYWSDHRVFQHTHGPKRLHHESIGVMTLNYETLIPPTDPDLRVIVYTADAGSPSAEKLETLRASHEAAAGPNRVGLACETP